MVVLLSVKAPKRNISGEEGSPCIPLGCRARRAAWIARKLGRGEPPVTRVLPNAASPRYAGLISIPRTVEGCQASPGVVVGVAVSFSQSAIAASA